MERRRPVSGYLEPIVQTIRQPNERQADADNPDDQLVGTSSRYSLSSLGNSAHARMLADFCSMVRDQTIPSRQQNASRTGIDVGRAEQHRRQIYEYLTSPVVDARGQRFTGLAEEFLRRVMHSGIEDYFANGGIIKLTSEDMSNTKKALDFLQSQEATAGSEHTAGENGEAAGVYLEATHLEGLIVCDVRGSRAAPHYFRHVGSISLPNETLTASNSFLAVRWT